MPTHSRRTVLAGAGLALGSLAGCLGGGGTSADPPDDAPELPTPSLGPDSREAADVVIASWEDYRCPHCATFSTEVVPRVRSNLVGDGVRYEVHDFPIPVDERWSWNVAMAARSVQERAGAEAFWRFNHRAFERFDAMHGTAAVRSVAEVAGAAPDQVIDDVENDRHYPVVEADRERGDETGVRGTPAVFVDGESVGNSYEAIASAVADAR